MGRGGPHPATGPARTAVLRHPLPAALAAVPLLLCAAPAAAAPADAPPRYAALGDSYAAGVGAGAGREWITGIVLPRLRESFHPMPEGQSLGYLPAVTAATGPR
ncbi:hypothetical protein [Kitasatospora sp. NPDC005748]